MGTLIDSTVFVDYERGRLDLPAWLSTQPAENYALSVITLAELYHGLYRADTPARTTIRRQHLADYRRKYPVLLITEPVAEIAGRLRAELQEQGFTIGAHDLLIGATALHLDFSVATANVREFRRISGLKVQQWQGRQPAPPNEGESPT